MRPDELFVRYRELQAYVGWTDEAARQVAVVAGPLEPYLPDLIDDFYAEIDRHPEARKVITGGAAQVQRLKGTLTTWVRELFCGRDDRDYVARRWRVGWRHVEIGLDQVYTNVALSRLRSGLVRALHESWAGEPDGLKATVRALNTLLDLDLAIIEDAYQAEYAERLQRTERLAAIGQVAGGVAHELRNPLNVVKTSVYYLLNARNPAPEKKAEHLRRIERHVVLADGVITALSNFACRSPAKPRFRSSTASRRPWRPTRCPATSASRSTSRRRCRRCWPTPTRCASSSPTCSATPARRCRRAAP
jgi:signal transduction histidine kinase